MASTLFSAVDYDYPLAATSLSTTASPSVAAAEPLAADVPIDEFAQAAISREIVESTIKTLYTRRHENQRPLPHLNERNAAAISSFTPSSTASPSMTSPTAGSPLRISTTAAASPWVSRKDGLHKLDKSTCEGTIATAKGAALSCCAAAHEGIGEDNASSGTGTELSDLPTPTTSQHNSPFSAFSFTSTPKSIASVTDARPPLSSTSTTFSPPSAKSPFAHFDFISSAASVSFRSAPPQTAAGAVSAFSGQQNHPHTAAAPASRPPLLRSVSEDVVVNHRSDEEPSFEVPDSRRPTPPPHRTFVHPAQASGTRIRTPTIQVPASTASNKVSPLQLQPMLVEAMRGARQQHSRADSGYTSSTGAGSSDSAASSYSSFAISGGVKSTDRASGPHNAEGRSHRGGAGVPSSSPSTARSMTDDLSLPATFDQATADAVRRAAALVRVNTGMRAQSDSSEPPVQRHGQQQQQGMLNLPYCAALMGSCGNGFFGNIVRVKVAEMVDRLLPTSTGAVEDDVVSIVEYGALNSLSACLVKRIVRRLQGTREKLALTSISEFPSWTVKHCDAPGSDFRGIMRQQETPASEFCYVNVAPNIYPSYASRPFLQQIAPPDSVHVGLSLMDLHHLRLNPTPALPAATAAHSDLVNFLSLRAKEFKQDGLLIVAFIQKSGEDATHGLSPSTPARGDSCDVTLGTPRLAAHVGPGLQALNLATTPTLAPLHTRSGSDFAATSTTLSDTTGLTAPADSTATSTTTSIITSPSSIANTLNPPAIKTSNAVNAGISRTRSGSSPCMPSQSQSAQGKGSDLWSAIPGLLAPSIQRLVSTGLIKSDTARILLALPLHPRTPVQTQAALRLVRNQWSVEWSCGLPEAAPSDTISPSTPTPGSTFKPASASKLAAALPATHAPFATQDPALLLSHPAYTAYQSTTLSRVQFAEHAVQFLKVLFENHFRAVLRDYAKLGRSRVEEILDNLNEVIREKIEEPGKAVLALELEVCVLALRRL